MRPKTEVTAAAVALIVTSTLDAPALFTPAMVAPDPAIRLNAGCAAMNAVLT